MLSSINEDNIFIWRILRHPRKEDHERMHTTLFKK